MFQGEFVHNLDSKNRIVLPSKFRFFLKKDAKNGFFMHVSPLTPDKCIRLYTADGWAAVSAKIRRIASESDNMDAVLASFSVRSEFTEMDAQNRLVIPQRLIDYAGLEKRKSVVLVGCIDHIQVWNQDVWIGVAKRSEEELRRAGIRMKDIYGI